MTYFTNLFSPDTFETFSNSLRDVSGFSNHQLAWARRVQIGDRFICYMTKLGRWVGVLEVWSAAYTDSTPLFYPENDPYVIRFKVRPLVWLAKEHALPIRDKAIWDALSFTKGLNPKSSEWTGKVRISLNRIADADGSFLESALVHQATAKWEHPVDEAVYRRLLAQKVRRADKVVAVSVPDSNEREADEPEEAGQAVRESAKMQALLASIGEKMGYKIWLPKADRGAVLQEWKASETALMNVLPLNYNEPTLQTIEQIDVLWLKGRAIVRAFEVEHTTAVYSGILRMADLLALQPNMDIKLHIVAPEYRKAKVMSEIQRPVFSLLEKGPLAEYCTFIPYGGLKELAGLKHLQYLSDEVLEEYAEGPE